MSESKQAGELLNAVLVKTVNGEDFGLREAFACGTAVTFTLFLASAAAIYGARMEIAGEAGGVLFEKPMRKIAEEGRYSFFSVTVDTGELAGGEAGGLFWYRFLLDTAKGPRRVRRQDRLTLSAAVDSDVAGWDRAFLLTLYKEPAEGSDWLYGGIAYYVFIDRFCRAGEFPLRGEAVLNTDWAGGCPAYGDYPAVFLKNNIFFGGNLRGIATKLDHIAALGADCVCLSPVFESGSSHRYDAADFMRVEPMLGGEGAFAELAQKAARRGIRLILDADFGVTSDDSRYFNKFGRYDEVGAWQSEASPYRRWYTFSSGGTGYDCRFSLGHLPRLNWREETCRDFFVRAGGVIDRHMSAGASGFRLSFPEDLPPDALRAISRAVKAARRDGMVYGCLPRADMDEVAALNRLIVAGCVDSYVNYGVREAIVRYLRAGDWAFFRDAVEMVCAAVPPEALNLQLNPLGTPDTVRMITALVGEADTGLTNAQRAMARLGEKAQRRGVKLLKLAYLIAATLPGIPLIYYGDETGLEGYGDPFNRRCIPWHRLEGGLLRWYRKVGKMRREQPLYKDAPLRVNFATEDVLVFSRSQGGLAAITVVNRGGRTYRMTADAPFVSLLSNLPEPTTNLDIPPLTGTVLLSAYDEGGSLPDFKVLRR